jgi:hypothetical protein
MDLSPQLGGVLTALCPLLVQIRPVGVKHAWRQWVDRSFAKRFRLHVLAYGDPAHPQLLGNLQNVTTLGV